MIWMLFLQFIISFVTVFLKGIQTQTVVNGDFKLAFIISCVMSISTSLGVLILIDTGVISLIPISLGSSIGVILSMKVYRDYNSSRPVDTTSNV